MAMPVVGEGARALLFERLVDEDPRARVELRPLRTHTPAGLRASVLRRLDLLLNTRATRPRPADGSLTVLDYGLPDYTGRYGRDTATRTRIAAEIRRTIEAFEPRLQLSKVEVGPADDDDRRLAIRLMGRLRAEPTVDPVSFIIPLSGSGEAREQIEP